jgi:glycosyltransferase involved in cell wall biosynthesis
VLLVAYYFPPSGGSGVQRPLKFVKYLPRHGWDPVVLTVRADAAFPARDEKLLREIPPGVPVHRTRILEPHRLYARVAGEGRDTAVDVDTVARWDRLPRRARFLARIRATLFVPDARILWWPFALARGEALVRSARIDVILTTAPPFTTHLIGLALARRTGKPWVADWRDPWTRAPFYPPRPSWIRRLEERLEGRCLREARRNLVVVPSMAEEFLDAHPGLDPERLIVLPNGYDPEDFPTDPVPREARFTIVHVGRLFANRRPEVFFRVLARLLEEEPALEQRLQLVFVGRMDEETRRMLARPPLAAVVRDLGYLEHAEAIRWLLRGHLLLLPVGSGPELRGVATGKIFEYAASGTPVLAYAPGGEAARILRETGAGWVLDPADAEGTRRILREALAAHGEGRLLAPPRNEAAIAAYRRPELARRLAAILEEAASG